MLDKKLPGRHPFSPSVQFLIQKYEGHIEKKETELKKAEKLKVGIYEDLKDGLLDKPKLSEAKAGI